MARSDLTGRRFGKLIVEEYGGSIRTKYGLNASWLCRCDCGGQKHTMAYSLTTGRVRSCGCLRGNIRLDYYNNVVVNYEGDDCLTWPFPTNSNGYGALTINKKYFIVSRLLCTKVYGDPPTRAHQAAHSCGKGHLGCVAKSHLRWATPAENQADRIIHGTMRRRHVP